MRKTKLDRYLRNTASGALGGFIGAMVLAIIIDENFSAGIERLYTYVVSAILSLSAAALTLSGVFANIDNQNEIARRAREKRLLSARSLLPNSLRIVCRTARNAALYSSSIDTSFDRPDVSLPSDVVSVIRDVIEFTDDDIVSKRLIGLLAEHQTYLETWQKHYPSDYSASSIVPGYSNSISCEWAFLYNIAASLLPYARHETSSVERVVTANTRAVLVQRNIGKAEESTGEAEERLVADFARRYSPSIVSPRIQK